MYTSGLSLLLLISQTRLGASCVVNSGLFTSIRESGVFSVDPDLGFESENPSALGVYYGLLLSLTQILVACLLSCGPDNERIIFQMRNFCQECRPLIVAVFKRNARIGLMGESMRATQAGAGTAGDANNAVISELADALTVLVGGSGWLDVSDEIQDVGLTLI